MLLKNLKIFIYSFVIFILCINCNSLNVIRGESDIRSFLEADSNISFTYKLGKPYIDKASHTLNGEIKNNSTYPIMVLKSVCISELDMVKFENAACKVLAGELCGALVANFIKLKPNESYNFHIPINCDIDKKQMKVGFELIEPKNLKRDSNHIWFNEIRKNPQDYNSKIIPGQVFK